jgi:SecD/SecF fusion protein
VRERRNYLLLVGLILAALIGVALIAIPGSPAHRSPTLGLDLQGGLEVVLEAVPPKGHELTQADLDRSVSIMRNRIDKLGVSEPEIRKQGSNQIVIQLAGVHDPRRAAELIGKTAQLEFYDLEGDLTGPSIGADLFPRATQSLYDLLAGQQQKAKNGTPAAFYVFNPKKRLVSGGGPFDTREQAEKRRDELVAAAKKGGGGGAGYTILAAPEGTIVITCGGPNGAAAICPGGPGGTDPTVRSYYLFRHQPNDAKRPVPEMTGADLKLSGTRQDFDPQTGQPVVLMQFTGKGSSKFQDITRTLYQRGGIRQTPQHFAIVLDGDIASFPQIDYTDSTLSNGISGNAQITGLDSIGEAKDLALVLQTGALPVEFKQVERTDVSATLGKDSLQEAKTAAMIGLLVVALFLLVFYRFLGVIAVLGLGVYAAFLYAALLLFNVTLTLPGFAGLILTIGVAADANVVIFERIKEEVRSGKSIRAAVSAGYQKGFHTIVDANVVTAITALVLFLVATAQVKGFALMLLIGTVISLITAVAATRAMLGLLAGFRWFDNPRFMGAKGQAIANWQRIDVNSPKRRRMWLSIATALIVLSIIAVVVKGLNFGIDFKGGTQITFKTPQPVALSDVRSEMAAIGRGDAVVQGRGSSAGGDRYKSFQVRTKSLTEAQQNALSTRLEDNLGATASSVKNVSSSFSRQIARGAILAIIVSFILITLYITLRFQWRFAIPILRTLFNDILITLGIYALSGREVTTATVAAVLTVLGYSIYDTIIVFDRIRENIPLMPRASFATIANVSLWETMRRSLATTFITLLPVASLLLFGGETLKDFAFALFVGIGLGAVSTFFVATPFLTVLMERSPEFRRRVGSDVIEKSVGGVAITAVEPEPEPALTGVRAAGESAPELAAEAPAPSAPAAAAATGDGATSRSQAKRERRRQRRRTKPHGRAR